MSEYSSSVSKDSEGKYRVNYSYISPTDGKRHRSCKRGFKFQKDAKKWQRDELPKFIKTLEHVETLDENLTMEELIKEYLEYSKLRRRETTYENKVYLFDSKITGYFGKKKVFDITTKDISAWQNWLLKQTKADGTPLSPTYLRTISNQLSAVLNYAMTFHNLASNPVLRVERLGKKCAPEQEFWTVEEYLEFSKAIQDKPIHYYLFQVLFWTGIREGEALALTKKSFDFKRNTITVKNSYHRADSVDVLGDTKTDSSRRTFTIPKTLADEIKEYLASMEGLTDDERIFPVSKKTLYTVLDKGCAISGVKRIKIHGLRHSHISLLENSIGSAAIKDIQNRAGHTNSTMTLHYTHSYKERDAKIADEIDTLMGG